MQELTLLLKFFASMGELPKIEVGSPDTRGERLRLWFSAVETQLATTRKVVSEWWSWSKDEAMRIYHQWLEVSPLERNKLKVTEQIPRRYDSIES